jgi:hypothetical protein
VVFAIAFHLGEGLETLGFQYDKIIPYFALRSLSQGNKLGIMPLLNQRSYRGGKGGGDEAYYRYVEEADDEANRDSALI